jgi:RNA 2',3'-cyclic 3'-phosphodiesterase
MPGALRPRSLRLFLALWADDATRATLAAWQHTWQWPPGAKLVAPERLHLTLHFIGNVPAARRAELSTLLRVPFEPVDLAFGAGSVWPGGIAVLQPSATPRALADLHARLAQALRSAALPAEERPYRPHVTLARKAGAAIPPEAGASLRWRADSGYVLVQSLANGGGYDVLERFSRP